MHLSDIALECAAECLALAETVSCPQTSIQLAAIARRLSDAAVDDAALSVDGEDLALAAMAKPSKMCH
ncbi:hypothetical protein [Bradyrhizobium sp. 2TAF24]|uniref:hypothetical protein n=1 Tax=Bradyrhizobium sp. 2TAF24 TaxID=3233011 RepID=UPI003F930813